MSLLKKDQLQKSAGLLNSSAPEDHFLAYITADEKDMLVQAGGKETPTASGIKAYPPGMGDPNYANAESNQSGGNNNNWGGDLEEEAVQHPDYEEYGPTGWSGDSAVDAWETEHGTQEVKPGWQRSVVEAGATGTPVFYPDPQGAWNVWQQGEEGGVGDYKGPILSGGGGDGGGSPNIGSSLHGGATVKETFKKMKEQELPKGHPEWQEKEGGKTVKSTDTLTTTFHTTGRPDIIYKAPDNTKMGNYASRYELNQIKYIQDSKLNKVKGKLNVAGFTDLPKDATFQETKDYIKELNRQGKILDSWKGATDKHGNPLYDYEHPITGETTIEKWDREGYIPQSQSTKGVGFTGAAMDFAGGAPLSYDQLMADFNTMEEVGKSGGGAMGWQERSKTFTPNQWAGSTGQKYDPHTKIFTDRPGPGEDFNQNPDQRDPGDPDDSTPRDSPAEKWFANQNYSNNTFNFSFQNEYNTAKARQASILGNPSPMKYLAVNQSPYYDFLKKNKLDRGIL